MSTAPGWAAPRPDPAHGTYARYQRPHACRCDDCRKANATYMRERRKRNGNQDVRQQRIASREAARRFRERHPDEWRRILDAAYEQVMSEGA